MATMATDMEESQEVAPAPPATWTNLRIALSLSIGYVLVYFTRYPILMLPSDIQHQTLMRIAGTDIDLQTAFSLGFVISFGLAKVPAIKIIASPMFFRSRFVCLVVLLVGSAAAMALPLALSRGQPAVTTIGLCVSCFLGSMIYGGLITYIEGRQSTELLVAFINFALIFGGSASRGTGTAVLNMGVSPEWMPALVSGVVMLPMLGLLWVLHTSPPPTTEDIAQRRPRTAMTTPQMMQFMREFWPGLLASILAYTAITSIRQFRDLFNKDIFTAANHMVEPSAAVFFFVDFPGAAVSCISLALFVRFKDNRRAIVWMYVLMILFLVVMLLATAAFSAGMLDCFTWQMLVGMGLFGSYTMMATPVYDRLVGVSQFQNATCTFLVFISDGCGYIGSISLLIWKTFAAKEQSPQTSLDQFLVALYALTLFMIACLLAALAYFVCRLPSTPPPGKVQLL